MNKIYHKTCYYTLLVISGPIVTYIIIFIIYMLLFIYNTDPILCMGPDALTSSQQEVGEASQVQEPQEPLVDPEISERLKQLKAFTSNHSSLNHSVQVNDKLNVLNDLYKSDIDKLELVSEKYKYWNNLYLEARKQAIRNEGFEEQSYKHILHSLKECKHYMKRIRITEAGIKKLDPNFVSPSPKQWYEQ